MTKFSKWLEEAMFKHGGRKYGGAALAKDLSIRRATVSDWLKDHEKPRREQISKLALHFGTTSRHIYELLEIEPPDDLNDVLEEVNRIIHKLSPKLQRQLLEEVRAKYGYKTQQTHPEISSADERK